MGLRGQKDVLEKVWDMRAIDSRTRFEKRLKNINELPTLPQVASKIIALSSDPNVSASSFTKIIALDPSMTAKILKLVNSSFYGFPGKINSVTHAVVILGYNEVKNLVLATSVFRSFLNGGTDLSINKEALWRHSAATATVAKLLAGELGQKGLNEYFIAGLLHDIGLVYLVAYAHEEVTEIISRVRKGEGHLTDIENDVLGTNHSIIGSELIKIWNLPVSIGETVRCHHHPQSAKIDSTPSAVVNLACYLCSINGFSYGVDANNDVNEEVWEILRKHKKDLDEKWIDNFISNMSHELKSIEAFIELLQ